MRIAFDGSGLTPPQSGVGNYIQQLLAHLVHSNRRDAYGLMAHRRDYVDHWVNVSRNIRRVPVHFPNRFIWMQFLVPAALRRWHPDVAHFTNFIAPLASERNVVVTVHDVALQQFPGLTSRRQRLLMRPLIQPTVRRARVVITVSEQSKREILQTFALPSEQVRVIYEAAAPAFSAPADVPQETRRRAAYGWSPDDRHVLHVGTHQPRKNVPRLVTALHLVHQTGLRAHLWLVGQVGWGSAAIHQQVEALGLKAFVHFTGYVPVRDLRAFYRGCDVFVFPSLHEGFGLPVLEAMACGAPVAVAETPTLREIAGDAAEYFDPENTNRMADTMRRLLTDAEWARALGERGRARAELFSWERTARETHAVYAQVANGR